MEDARASELVASLAQAAGERHPGALIDMRGTAADAPVEVVPVGLQLPQGVAAV